MAKRSTDLALVVGLSADMARLQVELGIWTMPWKRAYLQAGLSTAMPSAAATSSFLDRCSFLAWDQSGWWTADRAQRPLGGRVRDRDPVHRVVRPACTLAAAVARA